MFRELVPLIGIICVVADGPVGFEKEQVEFKTLGEFTDHSRAQILCNMPGAF